MSRLDRPFEQGLDEGQGGYDQDAHQNFRYAEGDPESLLEVGRRVASVSRHLDDHGGSLQTEDETTVSRR